MISLFKLALEIQELLTSQKWKFCFIGGLAVQRWGEPRATQDVDLTLLTEFIDEGKYIDFLLSHYSGRIPEAKQFALANRVLLLQSRDKIGIDIALGGLPFEVEAIGRASLFEYAPGVKLLTASAEDLVIMKAFAARERDWEDVRGILVRSSVELDWTYVMRHLTPLAELKEEPEILERLKAIRSKK